MDKSPATLDRGPLLGFAVLTLPGFATAQVEAALHRVTASRSNRQCQRPGHRILAGSASSCSCFRLTPVRCDDRAGTRWSPCVTRVLAAMEPAGLQRDIDNGAVDPTNLCPGSLPYGLAAARQQCTSEGQRYYGRGSGQLRRRPTHCGLPREPAPNPPLSVFCQGFAVGWKSGTPNCTGRS